MANPEGYSHFGIALPRWSTPKPGGNTVRFAVMGLGIRAKKLICESKKGQG